MIFYRFTSCEDNAPVYIKETSICAMADEYGTNGFITHANLDLNSGSFVSVKETTKDYFAALRSSKFKEAVKNYYKFEKFPHNPMIIPIAEYATRKKNV